MQTLIFDIETDGLLDDLTVIHSLVIKDADTGVTHSFADQPGYRPIAEGLADLEDADRIVGHNIIKYDIPAIKKLYPDWAPRGWVLDTIVLAHLLWPEIKWSDDKFIKAKRMPGNMRGRFSLEAFGYRLGNHKGEFKDWCKKNGIVDPWAQWRPEMQSYCEQDVEVSDALWKKCVAAWQKGFSDRSVRLEHDVATILARQERHGFRFNVREAEKLYLDLIEERARMHDKLTTLFKPWWVNAGTGTVKQTRRMQVKDWRPIGEKMIKGKAGVRYEPIYPVATYWEGAEFTKIVRTEFNPGSRHHIANRLITLRGWKPQDFGKDGNPTVDDAILSQLPWPEAQDIALYLMVQKRIGSLAEGKEALLKAVKSDGRIHGRVESNGAVTGRMTHSNPPMAGNPKVRVDDDHKVILGAAGGYGYEFRSLFEVDPGKKLVGADADALELRCLAGYLWRYDSGAFIDTVLKGDKKLGTDMHSVNARALGLDPKKTYEWEGKTLTGRDIAKTWFYAFLYGAGNPKLGAYLPGGDKRTDSENAKVGKKARMRFLVNLPALGKLVEKVQEKAKGQGFIIGLDGRKIFVRSGHSALNTLLQGAGAIIMKEALVILDRSLVATGLSPGRDYEFCANVHDEWQIEVTEAHAELVRDAAEAAIEKAGESLSFKCPLAGNGDIGRNWAETH